MKPAELNFALQKNYSPFIIQDLPNIQYVMTSIEMPEITLNTDTVSNPQMPFEIPTQLEFGDLKIEFLLDENFENYKAILDWMMRLGFNEKRESKIEDEWSDGSFSILNNNNNPIYTIDFVDCFPISLGGPSFSSKDGETEITSTLSMKYTSFHMN